jgi:protein MpaA
MKRERWAFAAVLLLGVAPGLVPSASEASRGDPVGRRQLLLGRSVQGRPIRAVEVGDLDSEHTALVVGCIHGDETAGIAVVDRLASGQPPSEVGLWIVPNLNPDGVAAGTRGNAHGVDLNRNFPWRWTRLRGIYDSGPRLLSEPETRIAFRLVNHVGPHVSIWFHQHLDVVDDGSGNRTLERRFATIAGLGMRPLVQEPGSATTWASHRFPTGTSFVVELPAGRAGMSATERLVRAVLATIRP